MVDESWKVRAGEDAWTRLTGLGLLIEVCCIGLIALLAWFFDELSGPEQVVTVVVLLIGFAAGCLLVMAPRPMTSSLAGRTLVGWTALVQVALLITTISPLDRQLDPELGLEAGPATFRLAAVTCILLILTGCLRALFASRLSEDASRRRAVSVGGGIVAALTFVAFLVIASANTTGLSCAVFSFDPSRWQTGDRDRLSNSLVACDELIGKTKTEVHASLGPGGGGKRAEHFGAGQVGSDAKYLIVRYDNAGRVREAEVIPPG